MLITPISSYLRQRLIIYDNSDSLYVLNERARKEQIMKIKFTALIVAFIVLVITICSCRNDGGRTEGADTNLQTEPETVFSYDDYSVDDARYINKRTVSSYCCTNEALIPEGTAVTGFVLEFPGLDGNSCLGGSMDNMIVYNNSFTKECAGRGIVVAYMFPGPWSWMNKGAVRITDLVVDALADKYGLSEGEFSLVVMGGSMGGQAALIYSMDSRHKIDACVAHCPCYNVVECFSSHEAFPRTFLSAVNAYDMPLEEALLTISPEQRMADLPKIPYLVTADELDEVFPVKGVERFVGGMKDAGHSVTYLRLADQKHGGISQADRDVMNAFVLKYSKINK